MTDNKNELKQVRDALENVKTFLGQERLWKESNYVRGHGEKQYSELCVALSTLDRLSAPVGVPVGYMLDMWTLPYNSNDSDNRIRKVIDTLGLPNNSTGVWGALKQLENEIRHALVSDYNAAPTPAPTAVDLDALKRLLYPSIPRTYEDAIACATIDHIAAQFDFVRKV